MKASGQRDLDRDHDRHGGGDGGWGLSYGADLRGHARGLGAFIYVPPPFRGSPPKQTYRAVCFGSRIVFVSRNLALLET